MSAGKYAHDGCRIHALGHGRAHVPLQFEQVIGDLNVVYMSKVAYAPAVFVADLIYALPAEA